jgi:hypothetical protein
MRGGETMRKTREGESRRGSRGEAKRRVAMRRRGRGGDLLLLFSHLLCFFFVMTLLVPRYNPKEG